MPTDEVKTQLDALLDRLFLECRIDEKTGCWVWTGYTTEGYGRVDATRWGFGVILVHRLSYLLWKGPLAEGECALHDCDNPPCFNPDHLFKGTKGDNNRDRKNKGRNANRSGSQNPLSKITEDLVRTIRSDPRSGKEAAEFYGLARSTISQIRTGKLWPHVPFEGPNIHADAHADAARRRHQDPEQHARMMARIHESRRRSMADPEKAAAFSARMSEVAQQQMADPMMRARITAKVKQRMNTEEAKARASAEAKARWSDPDMALEMALRMRGDRPSTWAYDPEEIRELHNSGLSQTEIASRLGCAPATVRRYLERAAAAERLAAAQEGGAS